MSMHPPHKEILNIMEDNLADSSSLPREIVIGFVESAKRIQSEQVDHTCIRRTLIIDLVIERLQFSVVVRT